MAELPEDKCWLAVAPSFNHFAIFHSQCNVQCKCCYWISSTQLTLKMQEHNLHCYSAHKGWEVRAIFCRASSYCTSSQVQPLHPQTGIVSVLMQAWSKENPKIKENSACRQCMALLHLVEMSGWRIVRESPLIVSNVAHHFLGNSTVTEQHRTYPS